MSKGHVRHIHHGSRKNPSLGRTLGTKQMKGRRDKQARANKHTPAPSHLGLLWRQPEQRHIGKAGPGWAGSGQPGQGRGRHFQPQAIPCSRALLWHLRARTISGSRGPVLPSIALHRHACPSPALLCTPAHPCPAILSCVMICSTLPHTTMHPLVLTPVPFVGMP